MRKYLKANKMFSHERGFLHNDLESNNVVIDGSENKPVIIDFGKSCKIVKARLRKPNIKVARYSFSGSIPPKFEHKLRRHKQSFGKIATTVVLDEDENLL